MLFEKLARNISDIPGVEGLCLFELGGVPLYNRMPTFIPETALEEALRRIQALYETIDENFLPADDYLLRFSGRSLLLRRLGTTILLLLTDEKASPMSLRMVTNMVLKQLQTNPELLAELRLAAPKPSEKTPTKTSPALPEKRPGETTVPASPAQEKKHLRIYRGQLITD